MLSIELKVAVTASVSVLGSILLASMCLFYRRRLRNKRSRSNSMERGKSDNPHEDTPGIRNIACDDTHNYGTCKEIDLDRNVSASETYDYVTIVGEPIYDVCDEVQEKSVDLGLEEQAVVVLDERVYAVLEEPPFVLQKINLDRNISASETNEYVTIEEPIYDVCDEVQEMSVDLDVDSLDERVYAVLEGPSEQEVTSDPIYFTLERNANQSTEAGQINENEEHSGRTGEEGIHGDTCAVNIQDEIYENVQALLGDHVVSTGLHGISEDIITGDLDDHTDRETRTSKVNEGYTDDEGMAGDIDEQEDRDEVEDGDHESPDEGIYENWENETVSKKKQDCFESCEEIRAS